MAELIERHGWHVIGELGLLLLFAVFTIFYVRALVRGNVRAIVCSSCGRVSSRSDPKCSRCGAELDRTGAGAG